MLIPGRSVPPLKVPLVEGGTFDLGSERAKHFCLVVFYRGLHCAICKETLRELEERFDAFASIGVDAVAISGDSEADATRSREEWAIERLRIGYGLNEASAREWGLFVSSAALPGEPDRFFEPALFLVRPDQTLYGSSVNSMPFARASIADLETALSAIIEAQYPPRGLA